MDSADLAKLLEWRRGELGKTQTEVAAESGSTQATISRLEGGRRDVRFTTLLEVARALGMDIRLVPSEVIPAVDDLIRGVTSGQDPELPLYILDDIEIADE